MKTVRVYHGEPNDQLKGAMGAGGVGSFLNFHGPQFFVTPVKAIAEQNAIKGGQWDNGMVFVFDIPEGAIVKYVPHGSGMAFLVDVRKLRRSDVKGFYRVYRNSPSPELKQLLDSFESEVSPTLFSAILPKTETCMHGVNVDEPCAKCIKMSGMKPNQTERNRLAFLKFLKERAR